MNLGPLYTHDKMEKSGVFVMIVVGVTGSMGMGKTTVCQMLHRCFGFPVWDADAHVRYLLANNPGIRQNIAQSFPKSIDDNGNIDRTFIRQHVFDCVESLRRLEEIIHPVLAQSRQYFYRKGKKIGAQAMIIDVPLLFEKGIDAECDIICVVHAPIFMQAQRILGRPGMTTQIMEKILSRQWSDIAKKTLADRVIQTGLGKNHTYQQLKIFYDELINA